MDEQNSNYTKTLFPIKISNLNNKKSGARVLIEGRIITNSGKILLQDSTGLIEICKKKGHFLTWTWDIHLICGTLIKHKGKISIRDFNIVDTITLSPGNLSTTFNNKPEIYCLFNNSYLPYKTSITMFIDNNEISTVNQGNKILYVPNSPLSFGEHLIRLTINDNHGNERTINWLFNIEKKNRCYKLFFGVPHCHTCISDGRGLPDKAIDYSKNNGLDFIFITDHSNYFDGVRRDNYEFDIQCREYKEVINSDWYNTGVAIKKNNSSSRDFIAIRGFEMTSEDWGHINVLNSNNYVEGKHQIKLIEDFFAWIKKQNNVITVINHPGSHFKSVINHLEMDGVINLIEVGNGAFPRKYRRFEKYYYNALDNGWHLGAINGQDNHIDNWGDNENLTVILAEEITIENTLHALKNRHTYSTESKHLKLMIKANDYIMGSVIPPVSDNIINFEIAAENTEVPISCIQIISNGGSIIKEEHFEKVYSVFWKTTVSIDPKRNWYVIKVILLDNKIGISSPIFTS